VHENDIIAELIYIIDDENVISDFSSIYVKDISPNEIKFGDTIKASLNIYRGNTSKYAVYAFVEDDGTKISEKSTIHVKNKFTNYTFSTPIQLKPNCDNRYKDGDYLLVIEGLDIRTEQEISIEGINSRNCDEIEVSSTKSSGKLSYDIIEMPYTISLNKEFFINLKIENEYDDDVDLEVWSYVYRGPKKYSEEKENLVYLTIEDDDSREVSLPIIVKEGGEGSYKLKVKIRKKGRITTYDKTKDIYLKVPLLSESEKVSIPNLASGEKTLSVEETPNEQSTQRNEIIYESDNFKIKKLIPFFMLILILLSIGFSIIALKN
jgi:hypothetical protein